MSKRRDPLLKSSLSALALAVSVSLFSLAGCGGDKPDALVASAKDYLAKKQPGSAVIQLKSALQQQPDLAEARFLLGRTLLDSGDAATAEVELRKAFQLKYPEDTVLPVLARAIVAQGRSMRVIQDYASTRLADPAAQADLQTVLATAYLQQNEFARAQLSVDTALKIEPGFGPALLMQSRLKAANRDFDAAYGLIDQVLAKDPSNYEALQMKGDLLFFVKSDEDAALAAQRQALAARRDWLPSHRSIIEILLLRHDLAGATAQLAAMKKVLPNQPLTGYFEAELAYLNRDYKTARELTQQLLRVAPDNVKVLLLASGVELQSGSLAQAESYGAKALQIAPDIAVTRRLLGQIYLRSGQAPKALDTLAPLVDKPDVTADTVALAGQAALESGDPATAEAYFKRASQLDPGDARIRTVLALTQFSKGKSDLGFSQLSEIALSDKGTTADMALISERIRQRQFELALEAIAALQRKQPDKPTAAQLRGQVQVQLKDVAAARQSFEEALKIDPSYFPAASALATLDARDKHFDAARAHFDKLLAIDPKNVQALIAIADLRTQAGASNDEVVGLLSNAVKLNPGVAGPRLSLIELYLRQGDSKRALSAAQEGVAALPDDPAMADALGRAQMATGDINQAIIQFKKLVIQQPQSPQPLLRLSDAYMVLKNRDGAREMLQRALAITPTLLPAQRALVMLELGAGRPDEAMKVARTVQAQRPSQTVGLMLAGDVDVARKNWSGAAASFRAAMARSPGTDVAIKLHNVELSSGKTADAQAFADSWIKDHPQDAGFISYLGDVALSHSDFATAEKRYLAVVQLQPENPIALNNLAWITSTLKKPGALAYAEKANSLLPDQPPILDTLATVLGESGQWSRAIELEKKALSLAPTQYAFQLNLAKLYLKSGDKSMAKSELDQLAKLGGKFATGQAEIGELLKSQ